MTEITCARCGCEGVHPFVAGANFCGKCSTEDDAALSARATPEGEDLMLRLINEAERLEQNLGSHPLAPLFREAAAFIERSMKGRK